MSRLVALVARRLAAAVTALVVASTTARAQAAPADRAGGSAEATVRRLYDLVSFTPDAPTDWTEVRALFLPEAVVFLRTSRTASTLFTLDGFIADFMAFDTLPAVTQRGFTERVVRTRAMEFRDVAHVLVLYEASIPGSPRAPQQGVDSFQLVRRDGRWRILSVTNDVVTPETPIPAELRP
jgi:hypothetical protein